MRSHGSVRAVLAATIVLSTVVGGCARAGRREPVRQVVEIRAMRFEPPTVRVAPGDTVEWRNHDLVDHTVTARDGAFDSGSLSADSTWSLVVPAGGTFDYACRFHPTMVGRLQVGS